MNQETLLYILAGFLLIPISVVWYLNIKIYLVKDYYNSSTVWLQFLTVVHKWDFSTRLKLNFLNLTLFKLKILSEIKSKILFLAFWGLIFDIFVFYFFRYSFIKFLSKKVLFIFEKFQFNLKSRILNCTYTKIRSQGP